MAKLCPLLTINYSDSGVFTLPWHSHISHINVLPQYEFCLVILNNIFGRYTYPSNILEFTKKQRKVEGLIWQIKRKPKR